MKKRRRPNTKKSPLAVLIFGILFSLATLILLSFISSLILMSTEDPLTDIKTASLAVLLSAAAISGFAISKYRGDLNFGISILISVLISALMLIVSIVSSHGNIGGGIFMNYLCYALVSVFFSFVGRKRAKRHHR